MPCVVLVFHDADAERPIWGICTLEQYDTPLQDISTTLDDFLTELIQTLDRRLKLTIERTEDFMVDLTVSSTLVPPDPTLTGRWLNRSSNLSIERLHKEHPNVRSQRQ